MDFDLNDTPNVDEDSSEKGFEAGEGLEALISEIAAKLAPGSPIDDLESAYLLYCEYARLVGFSVRKGSQNYFRRSADIQMKLYHCSCEGVTDNRASKYGTAAYKKHQRRTECKARLRVIRESVNAKWKVATHEREHNHEMFTPDQSYLLRSVRKLSNAHKTILEQMHSAGIGVSKACRFMENESFGVQNTGFIRKDAYDHMNRIRAETKIPNGDANAILQMFADKVKTEPYFYSTYMLDDDGRLMNFFFRDSRSAADYDMFGDVLSLDMTFKTNKYNLICAPFIGINHHRYNVMFGLGFLSDESARSFQWLLSTFLHSMMGKEPEVIFTDQCKALMKAVDKCFTHATHRLCQWHVNQNAPAHFGRKKNNKELKHLWYKCMSDCETEKEFDDTWNRMIFEHGFSGSEWFEKMYRMRRRWADVFTNDIFSAGLHATSRSETTNKVLKDLSSRSCSLTEFIGHFERIQLDWRTKERAEDAMCIGVPGQLANENHLLTHASRVYTRNVYKLIEMEAINSMSIELISFPHDYSCSELEFSLRGNGMNTRTRRVIFHQGSLEVRCTCRLWETNGYLCRHIFKVLYTVNFRRIPEQHIKKRWTRAARNRSPNNLITPAIGDVPMEMVFVNNVMRLAYAIAQEGKEKEPVRQTINECMTMLYNTVCGSQKQTQPTAPNKGGENGPDQSGGIRNSPQSKHGWYPQPRRKRIPENSKRST